jgi:hypothetical protein
MMPLPLLPPQITREGRRERREVLKAARVEKPLLGQIQWSREIELSGACSLPI